MIQDMASFRKNHGGIRRHGIFFVKVLGITRDMGSFRHVSSIWQVRVDVGNTAVFASLFMYPRPLTWYKTIDEGDA